MFAAISGNRIALSTLVAAVALAVVFTAADIMPAASQDTQLLAYQVKPDDTPEAPWSAAWNARPAVVVLSAQNVSRPMGGGEVATVRVRALHDNQRLYVLLEWSDKSKDELVNGQNRFADAAAVEMPPTAGVSVPSFCMGDAQGSVNIWQWKASWQRDIESGFATASDLYPGGFVDAPSPADDIFLPALALGNPVAQRSRATPVENLVAAGFGTLTTANLQDIDGAGEWRDGRWRVVFFRPLVTAEGYPSLAVGEVTDVAFAVWDGSRGHRDGMKSVSQFMKLQLGVSARPEGAGGEGWWAWVLAAGIGAAALIAILWAFLVPLRSNE